MTSEKPHKTAPGSFQKPPQKRSICGPRSNLQMTPKMDSKVFQKWSRNGSKKSFKKLPEILWKWVQSGPQNGPQIGPETASWRAPMLQMPSLNLLVFPCSQVCSPGFLWQAFRVCQHTFCIMSGTSGGPRQAQAKTAEDRPKIAQDTPKTISKKV
jgi:hypothetical protein